MQPQSCRLAVIVSSLGATLPTFGLQARELVGLRIDGPNQLSQNSITPYRAYARFDDGQEHEVTLASHWRVAPSDLVTIDGFGRLAATSSISDVRVTVQADFEFAGWPRSASRAVQVVPGQAEDLAVRGLQTGDPELVGLRIDGPDEVAENTVTPYRVYAEFSDGREFDVTLICALGVDPGEYAAINQFGDFEALDVPGDREEAIQARFEFGGIEKTAEQAVAIVDVSSAGHALQFDGVDDVVRIPHSDVYQPTEVTVEMWIKPHAAGPAFSKLVRSNGVNQGPGGYIVEWNAEGADAMALHVFDHDGPIVRIMDPDANSTYIGNWHHVAGVYSSKHGFGHLYVDGVLKASATGLSGKLQYRNAELQIGNTLQFPNEAFPGQIDDVRVWNVARSQSDIRCDMHRVLRGDEEGLVGYWRFDDVRGQIARDSSPYGSDGVLGENADPEGDRSDPAWLLSEAPIDEPPLDPPLWGEPTLIPNLSTGEDWEVTVAADNLSLYLSSERAGFAVVDIYYSERESLGDLFSTPQLVPELSRPGYNNSDITPVLSANQLRIYLSQGVGQNGYDLYVADRASRDDPWNAPQPIVALNTSANETMVAVSNDDRFIVFMSARGGRPELWTLRRDSPDGEWSPPALFQELRDFRQGRGFYNFGGAFSRDDLTFLVAATPPGENQVSYWKMTRRSRNAPFGPPTRIEELGTSTGKTSISLTGDNRTMYMILISGGGVHGRVFVAELEGRSFCPPDCDQIRKLKAKCRGNTLKVTVKSGLSEGTQMTLDNNGLQKIVMTNARGKAKAVWENETGVHTVFVVECPEFIDAVICNP